MVLYLLQEFMINWHSIPQAHRKVEVASYLTQDKCLEQVDSRVRTAKASVEKQRIVSLIGTSIYT